MVVFCETSRETLMVKFKKIENFYLLPVLTVCIPDSMHAQTNDIIQIELHCYVFRFLKQRAGRGRNPDQHF